MLTFTELTIRPVLNTAHVAELIKQNSNPLKENTDGKTSKVFPVHAMKAYSGCGGIALLILTLENIIIIISSLSDDRISV
jgi:hypothetical protein